MTPKNDIQDELNQIGPQPPVNPYQIPAGYFDELPDRIKEQIKTESSDASDEIRRLSPLLAELKNKQTYQVDEAYFHEKISLLTNIPGHLLLTHSTPKRIHLWTRMAVAASLVGILGLGIYFYNKNSAKNNVLVKGLKIKTEAQFNQQLNELDSEVIIHYLNQFASVYDQSQLEKMIDPHTLPDESDYLYESEELNDLFIESLGAEKNM